jgi:hypothetical protein
VQHRFRHAGIEIAAVQLFTFQRVNPRPVAGD